MKQTIAQQIKWDFKTNGNLEIKDKNDNRIYLENSDGLWVKYEYDSDGNIIYFQDSNGFWQKQEYDSQGNTIYSENSYGTIIDKRPKPCENKVVEIEGIKYKLVKQ
jgi:YD repeat-containing protein